MDRRELLKLIAVLTGGTVVGANGFLAGCNTSEKKAVNAFDATGIAYLDEIAETILPATKTPGAKAAKVGEFMTVMVNDCYEEKDQKTFHEGMDKLNDASKKKFSKSFMDASPQQRHDLLVEIDKEAKDYQGKKKETDPTHYFTLMKQLTLLGYFTSEVGATQALRYVAVPGKYEGCIPYKKGDKAWA